jgi:MFS family permease
MGPKWLFDVERSVWALLVSRLVDAMGGSFFVVVLPIYLTRAEMEPFLGLSEPLSIGIVLSAFGFLSILQPLAGALSDYTGKRRL